MTMSTSLPARPRRTDTVAVSHLSGGAIVRARSGDLVLNPTALALWELCDGETDVDEMISAVCTLFALDRARASADVRQALAELVSVGVIT